LPPTTDTADVRPLILLVEDDAALGRALKFSLEVDGYRVELMDRAEALLGRAFPAGRVCVVTDLNLPGLSGIEALEELRRRGVTAPAILVTTQPGPVLLRRAADANATPLEKPILDDRLKTAIEAFWRD
jgi:two-component system, LuxR family, response regulator FixJ